MSSGQLGNLQLGVGELGGLGGGGSALPISLTGIASGEALGSVSIAGPILVSSISSLEAFGTIKASGPIVLTGITSAETFGTLRVAHLQYVTLTSGIASAQAFGTISIGGGITLLGGIASGEAFGNLSVLNADQARSLWIGGVQFYAQADSFKLNRNIHSTPTASFDLHYTGGSKPAAGEEVALFWDGVKRFGGLVATVQESTIQGRSDCSHIGVSCTGYQGYTDRAVVAKLFTVPIGSIAWIIIYDIWQNHLAQYGITYSFEGTSNELLGEQLFQYITVTEAFNRIVDADANYSWWIDDWKVLHYARTDSGAGVNGPFTVSRAGRDIDSVSRTANGKAFRNRQWVLPSSDLFALRVEESAGDGATTSFYTTYALNTTPIVVVDGIDQIVTSLGAWIAGWQWYYIPGGIGVFANVAPADGVSVIVKYPNPFPLGVSAEDVDSIADVGLVESVYHARNVNTVDSALALARGLLDRSLNDGEALAITYNSEQQPEWLYPGQRLQVDWTFPDVNDVFTVASVSSEEFGLTLWRHNVQLSRGTNDITEASVFRQITQTNSRLSTASSPMHVTLDLARTITGITNPGLATGVVNGQYVFQDTGVLASWEATFLDAPTGAAISIDLFLNGVSIFPSARKITIPDGGSVASGYQFVSDNIPYRQGDIMTAEVLSVGSTNPGADGTIYLNCKPRLN